MEIVHFEAHDVDLGLEALETGFAIDDLLVNCRSGKEWVMPGNPSGTSANGFFWCESVVIIKISLFLSTFFY